MKNDNNIKNRGIVKVFGFRSGAVYKMVPAIMYYAFMLFLIVSGIYGEICHYKFENIDYILFGLKYIFFIIWFFSPLIFLSDFKFRDSLPLFKKHSAGASVLGMIIVTIICSSLTMIYKECMSDTYKESVSLYDNYLLENNNLNDADITDETTEEISEESQSDKQNEDIYGRYGSGDNYVEDVFGDETLEAEAKEEHNKSDDKSEKNSNTSNNKSDTTNKSNNDQNNNESDESQDDVWSDFY